MKFHEDSPDCRIPSCPRLVAHEGDICTLHGMDDSELEAFEYTRPCPWLDDEFDPTRISYGERYAHPEIDGVRERPTPTRSL